MATTQIVLDRQAIARVFTFGTTSAGGQGSVTIEKGTAATSTVVLDVKASASIGGDLNLTGNLNITGAINTQTVTNTNVTDLTIRLNDGGTTPSNGTSGIEIEGTSNTKIGAIYYDASSGSKFSIGDGTTQAGIVDTSSVQTLTNKTIGGGQISGNISGSAGNVTGVVAVANGGTGLSTTTAYGVIHAGTTATGNFQNSGTPGASGTVYTSTGPTSLPTWQTVTASANFRAAVVSGTQNGTNKVFTIGTALSVTGSEQVFLNGQLLTPGSGNDYTISGTTITFDATFTAPVSTDVIRVYGVY